VDSIEPSGPETCARPEALTSPPIRELRDARNARLIGHADL
jgi:hypothetical protein